MVGGAPKASQGVALGYNMPRLWRWLAETDTDEQLRSSRTDPQCALRGTGPSLVHPRRAKSHRSGQGRRPSIVYPPRDERKDKHVDWSLTDGTLRPSNDYSPGYELVLVNLLRERVAAWRRARVAERHGHDLQLLQWWRREGRERPLFFAQVEAAETIIFLKEARPDFLQGINVPRDEPSDERKAEDFAGFLRYACKMATGTGKTTVMGMLAAWSILNKVHDRSDARFSDVVLVVCPNVTIRSRLAELDPENGEASIYRTRDLVPPNLMKGPVARQRAGDELARPRTA